MKVEIKGTVCRVTRGPGDRRFRKSGWCADPFSTLLYHVKNVLNARGYDLIKKRMVKDGHLVDDLEPYIRTKNPQVKSPHIIIYDSKWALRCAADDWWAEGAVEIEVLRDIYTKQSDCGSLITLLEA